MILPSEVGSSRSTAHSALDNATSTARSRSECSTCRFMCVDSNCGVAQKMSLSKTRDRRFGDLESNQRDGRAQQSRTQVGDTQLADQEELLGLKVECEQSSGDCLNRQCWEHRPPNPNKVHQERTTPREYHVENNVIMTCSNSRSAVSSSVKPISLTILFLNQALL